MMTESSSKHKLMYYSKKHLIRKVLLLASVYVKITQNIANWIIYGRRVEITMTKQALCRRKPHNYKDWRLISLRSWNYESAEMTHSPFKYYFSLSGSIQSPRRTAWLQSHSRFIGFRKNSRGCKTCSISLNMWRIYTQANISAITTLSAWMWDIDDAYRHSQIDSVWGYEDADHWDQHCRPIGG